MWCGNTRDFGVCRTRAIVRRVARRLEVVFVRDQSSIMYLDNTVSVKP